MSPLICRSPRSTRLKATRERVPGLSVLESDPGNSGALPPGAFAIFRNEFKLKITGLVGTISAVPHDLNAKTNGFRCSDFPQFGNGRNVAGLDPTPVEPQGCFHQSTPRPQQRGYVSRFNDYNLIPSHQNADQDIPVFIYNSNHDNIITIIIMIIMTMIIIIIRQQK
jgi:hypothetical protein